MVDVQRENDVEQLRHIARTQQMQIEQLLKVLAGKCAELDELKGDRGDLQQTLALLERMHERALEQQGQTDHQAKETKGQRSPQRGHGPSEQLDLQRVVEVFELDEPDQTCPQCGGELQPWADHFETSEMIDVVEVKYRVVEVRRQKYTCKCGGCIETALGPERAIEGGRYSLSFAAKIAIDKYIDHIPLSRQARILKRHGVKATSQALWDQLWALGVELRPCYDELYEQLMELPVIGLDQTGWPKLDAKSAKPWQMWCLTGPKAVYHRICDDKSARTFGELVGDFDGVIVCDMLSTHGAGAREGPGIVLAGCWAHVRRRFAEAEPNFPEARVVLDWIRALYDLDAEAHDDAARANIRRIKSAAVLDQMKSWLMSQPALKTTALGSAIRYTLAYWPRFTRFVDDARIPLDNNATERAIRGPVVGRKNHYGSKSRRGTAVAAILYSLVETAKVVGVDPAAYLVQAVTAARRGEVLLPSQLA